MKLVKFSDISKIERSIDKINRLFMAPEAKESEFDNQKVTSKADIWSLGAILYLLVNCQFQLVKDESLQKQSSVPKKKIQQAIKLESMDSVK